MRSLAVVSCAVLVALPPAAPSAQVERLPTARLVPAPPITLPGTIDSNVPMVWDLVDGRWRLFAFTSWGGTPSLLTGPAVDQMQPDGTVTLVPDPGDGIWVQSVVADEGTGAWYGYYHHERPADECDRPDRFVLRLGAARSRDRGRTWEDLGVVLEAPPDTLACASPNLYVIGGVGDVSVMLTPDRRDLFLFFSQYSRVRTAQGVAVARLAWADRDAPVGRLTIWVDGAWLPPRPASPAAGSAPQWRYPAGTPLTEASRPFHDAAPDADTFWGPSVHWNHHLERYVMLVNRARDEEFNNDGIYVSYARTLDDPRVWTAPRKLLNHGEWYPQVVGLAPFTGTDKEADRRARFFLHGRSRHYIEFQR